MITAGKILFVKKGILSQPYDNLPVVVERINEGSIDFYKIRYQNPGLLSHGHWYLTAGDLDYYLKER